MATYEPPTADLPEFDTTVFTSLEQSLTIAEADTRYLRFPLAQGDETIPNLTVGGVSTLGTATFTDNNPAYRIEYPVNSGRFDFFANTAGGVLTRGCKIDATGVHTNSKLDTIDEVAGTLDIGVNAARTGAINIGNGADGVSARTINIGNATGSVGSLNLKTRTIAIGGSNCVSATLDAGTITISGSGGNPVSVSSTGTLTLSNGSSSAMNIGHTKSAGSIDIGASGTTTSSTAINIGTSSNYTGVINIGTGTGNINSVNIGRSNMITIDGESGLTPTIFFNRPITPSYTPSSIASTTIGYTDFPTASSFGTLSTTVSNIAQFSIGAGVWDVKARVRIASIASVAGNFFRMGFTSTAGSLGTLYGDWNQDGISGNVNILLSGTFSVNLTTTIYVRGSCNSAGGGGACDVCDVIATRIA